MNSRVRGTLLALGLACLCSACATPPPTRTPDERDPFERINRGSFAFNQALDKAVLRPAIRGYRKVTPRVVRTGLSNFFSNAEYPVVIVNNLLQGKFAPAASDTGRFLLNTTLGIGGLLDPATDAGLDRNNEDFGQTLGRWRVPSGPYVMLPFLGPYTVRDGFGALADNFLEPRQLLSDQSTNNLIWAGGQLDRRSRLSDADAIIDRAGDPYAFVRSAYLQRRQYLVTDGAAADDAEPLEDPLEDPELMEDASGDAPPQPQ
jgi:phospholipid-binding lipoprotein MlaA